MSNDNGIGNELCWVFFDNSNIFITGQQYGAKKFKLRVPNDPRFRIDLGVLHDLLVWQRKKQDSVLYGSQPPAVDTAWEAIRQKNIKTKIFQKNARNLEKEVDIAMASDITEAAIKADLLYKEKIRTFIVLTGDRDQVCSFQKVLDTGNRLEIVSFKSALSSRIENFQKKNKEEVAIFHLEDMLADGNKKTCWYLNDKWNDCRPHKVAKERSFYLLWQSMFLIKKTFPRG